MFMKEHVGQVRRTDESAAGGGVEVEVQSENVYVSSTDSKAGWACGRSRGGSMVVVKTERLVEARALGFRRWCG